MSIRKTLFEQADNMIASLQQVRAMIQNPVEDWDWEQVEEARQQLMIIGNDLKQYSQDVDNYITENTPIWAEQWDLAQQLFAPYNDPDNKYDPESIDIATLAKELNEKGLCTKLAEVVATGIKYPQLG